MPFYKRRTLYADGAKGMAVQAWRVVWNDADGAQEDKNTGLNGQWRRENRNDPGKTTYWDADGREIPFDGIHLYLQLWAEENGVA